MSTDRESGLQQALSLPPDDRAYVATTLGQSLCSDANQVRSEEFLSE